MHCFSPGSPLSSTKRGAGRMAREASRAHQERSYFTAGVGAFFRGLPATVLRDMIFGGCFGSLRTTLRSQAESRNAPKSSEGALQFAADFVAAAAATALSSPINYARNLQFGTKLTDAVPSTAAAVQGLADEAASQPTTLGESTCFCSARTSGGARCASPAAWPSRPASSQALSAS